MNINLKKAILDLDYEYIKSNINEIKKLDKNKQMLNDKYSIMKYIVYMNNKQIFDLLIKDKFSINDPELLKIACYNYSNDNKSDCNYIANYIANNIENFDIIEHVIKSMNDCEEIISILHKRGAKITNYHIQFSAVLDLPYINKYLKLRRFDNFSLFTY